MQTDCSGPKIKFQGLGRRRVEGNFDAGRVSSDGGVLLLSELESRILLIERFASCFTDFREPSRIEHTVVELLKQRIYGLCLGYEDLNDHDVLRGDALLAVAVGKVDSVGAERRQLRDQGKPLAGKSTLNRLELSPRGVSVDPYKKISADEDRIERFFVEEFIDSHRHEAPERLVLDIDPTDIQLHGAQEGRFFHGYYNHYCYLPLFVFCGEDLLLARLRTADRDGADGTVEALAWLVPILREQWPDVEIAVRADSGFARESIFAWCEANNVEYMIGLARNPRLTAMVEEDLDEVVAERAECGGAVRRFRDFNYRTLTSWTRDRRVVAKVEALPGKTNPRYVVTSYDVERFDSRSLYEDQFCQRGEAENRLKEQQLDLFGDRASCTKMAANQLRLWFSAVAYMFMVEFRRTALQGTPLARAQTTTIRTRLLKLGTLIHISVRRVRLLFSTVFPLQQLFRRARDQIDAAYLDPRPI